MSKNFTLCVIAPELIPLWGGAGSYTINLLRNLPKKMEIHVVTPLRKSWGSEKNDENLPQLISEAFSQNVHIHFISRAKDTFVYNARFQLACLRVIPNLHMVYKFDLVHSHSPHMPEILLRSLTNFRLPTVSSVHNLFRWMRRSIKISGMSFFDLDRSEKGIVLLFPFLKHYESFYLKSIDSLIAPSQHCKRQLMKYFDIPTEKISTVYNGVDTELFAPTYGRNSQNEQPTILFVGRPIAQKGINTLVNVMKAVIKSVPEICFTFAGGGDFSPYFREFKREGISSRLFRYLGHVDYFQMPQLYSSSTIFVLPSPHENCSMSIIEAMSCEKTVVASNVGGNSEIIKSGYNGMLFDYSDDQELAETIVLLIKDLDLRNSLGRRARKTVVEKFSVKRMVSETIKVYEKTLDRDLA